MSLPTERGRRPRRIALLALIGVLVLAAAGVHARLKTRADLRDAAEASVLPQVVVIAPSLGGDAEALSLPGTVEAYADAPIYARTGGYLKSWSADIGAHVKRGEVLAVIEAPELDQQLRQAEADVATAEANEKLARTTARRWSDLLESGAVSSQSVDEKVADAAAKKTLVESARANLARLHELASFKRVVAPFDGIVTERRTDVGALINAGSGSGQELFHVAATDRLRVYVRVPQAYSAAMVPGLKAELRFVEHAGTAIPAQVVRTSNSVDSATRTLLAELEVDNRKGQLLPGSYTEVRFQLAGAVESLRVPANTLLFRAEGAQLAAVGAEDKIELRNVVLGRDFGQELEVLSGISPTDRIVVNPPDSLTGGVSVRVVQPVAATAAKS